MTAVTPYDAYPYLSRPIPWSAPERLALTSLLHGGPRLALDRPFRMLELGCGDGANLLPLAYYRPQGEFVGVDSAHSRIGLARERQRQLQLTNVRFEAIDVRDAVHSLEGHFDVVVGHGVFSWVPVQARDAILALCAERVRPGGLVYLNYNTTPGWSVRGLVRQFLMAQTEGCDDLRERTDRARSLAQQMAEQFATADHPYSALMASEFRFVGECPPSHTAHEYLSADNHAYSREQFLSLMAAHGLTYVGDADFSFPSGRMPERLPSALGALSLSHHVAATADLLCYRQLHSPILARAGWTRRPADLDELGQLLIASPAQRCGRRGEVDLFAHPSGSEIAVASRALADALHWLGERFPGERLLSTLFTDVSAEIDDVLLLHRQGLIEMRLPCSMMAGVTPEALHALERASGYLTSATHLTVAVPA